MSDEAKVVYVDDADEPAPYVSPEEFTDAWEAARAAHPHLVFSDDLAAFRADLVKQLNGMFTAMAKRIERRVEKRVGDRAESIVLEIMRKAGYGRAAR